MITKPEKAKALFDDGCNCAQAVLAAFANDIGMDEKSLMAMMAGFGGGVAGTHSNICGAASGMLAAISLLRGYVDPKNAEAKAAFNAALKLKLKEFEQENASIICKEIILSSEGLTKRERCSKCVACAARLVEENLNNS